MDPTDNAAQLKAIKKKWWNVHTMIPEQFEEHQKGKGKQQS